MEALVAVRAMLAGQELALLRELIPQMPASERMALLQDVWTSAWTNGLLGAVARRSHNGLEACHTRCGARHSTDSLLADGETCSGSTTLQTRRLRGLHCRL